MRYLRSIAWWSWLALLLATGAVAVGIWWPERVTLALTLGMAGITTAVLAMREDR